MRPMTRLGRTIFQARRSPGAGSGRRVRGDVARAAVVVGADGKTTRVNPPSTPTPAHPAGGAGSSRGADAGRPGLAVQAQPSRSAGRRHGGGERSRLGRDRVGHGRQRRPSTGSTQLIGDKDFNTCKKFPPGTPDREAQSQARHRARRPHLLDLFDHLQAVPAAGDHPGQQQEGHRRGARADHARGGLPAVSERARFRRVSPSSRRGSSSASSRPSRPRRRRSRSTATTPRSPRARAT